MRALRRALVSAVTACLTVAALAACGHSSGGKSMNGMSGMDMNGMNMTMNTGGSGDDMPGMGEPSGPKIAPAALSDNGLHAALGGYSYVADSPAPAAGSAAPSARGPGWRSCWPGQSPRWCAVTWC